MWKILGKWIAMIRDERYLISQIIPLSQEMVKSIFKKIF